jgi:hypothetical protein
MGFEQGKMGGPQRLKPKNLWACSAGLKLCSTPWVNTATGSGEEEF